MSGDSSEVSVVECRLASVRERSIIKVKMDPVVNDSATLSYPQ
jgi:hypothetical protein